MAPHAGVCTIENSPRKIHDLFPLLSSREESILSNEIAYGLKKSYHLNTKGGGFFFAFFFFFFQFFKAEVKLTGLIIIASVLGQVAFQVETAEYIRQFPASYPRVGNLGLPLLCVTLIAKY